MAVIGQGPDDQHAQQEHDGRLGPKGLRHGYPPGSGGRAGVGWRPGCAPPGR